jgi:alanyl-tRNA synthetase
MGEPYQELIAQKDIISKVIREEENSFFRTLELGIKRMELLMNECKAQNQPIIAGNAVFELYDTYGFPVDLTSLIARENGLSIDEQAFDKELQIQRIGLFPRIFNKNLNCNLESNLRLIVKSFF